MNNLRKYFAGILRITLFLTVFLGAGWVGAQTNSSQKADSVTNNPALAKQDAIIETRKELLRLLRMTPTLTSAVAHDPSLLTDMPYVARNNPALAQFLDQHPEIARNAEFFLFAYLENPNGSRENGLERDVWPDLRYQDQSWDRFWNDATPALVISFLAIVIFRLIRLALENSRWKRAIKGQADLQNKLLDKFTSNEGLIAYLETDAGKKLMQMPQIPAATKDESHTKGMLDRVLVLVQVGTVLISVGSGLRLLPVTHANSSGILTLSTLLLTLGLGLAIAATISWLVAHHYGLLPSRLHNEDNEQSVR